MHGLIRFYYVRTIVNRLHSAHNVLKKKINELEERKEEIKYFYYTRKERIVTRVITPTDTKVHLLYEYNIIVLVLQGILKVFTLFLIIIFYRIR